VEVWVFSGSLASLWPSSFWLFDHLDFGPCPLVSFSCPFLGAFFFIKFGKVSSSIFVVVFTI
jgi:hypothetical protein